MRLIGEGGVVTSFMLHLSHLSPVLALHYHHLVKGATHFWHEGLTTALHGSMKIRHCDITYDASATKSTELQDNCVANSLLE